MKKDLIVEVMKNKSRIKKFLGYSTKRVPSIIENKLEMELCKVEELIDPRYYYLVLNIEEISEFWDYKVFSERKYMAKKLALIIYTIGEKIQVEIERYSQSTEMIRGLILDKIGIVVLDSLKDRLIKKIQDETGLKRVYEVYPMNGDFPVEGQRLIYDKLNEKNDIEKISINEYFQLSPIKSVAMVVILGEEKEDFDMCNECKGCKLADK
ncbi:MAG: hypothetical protein ACRDA4_04855 [Filifactoraceae bacterium]